MNLWTVGCADPRLTAQARSPMDSITAILCFTPRWSCSTRLFRYFDERSLVFAGSQPSAFSARTARCDAA